MSASPDDLAARVLVILSDAEHLEALSRIRPHAFAEQKSDLVQKLKELHSCVREIRTQPISRLPERSTTFTAGVIKDRRGRRVVAERRNPRQIQAR